MSGFTPEQKRIVLARDSHTCPICGQRATEVNHRANRGHGGHRASNRIANGCAICSTCNGLIESDADRAALARDRGVKLSRYADPLAEPYLHPLFRMLVLLDDAGGFEFV